jgi:hypothetical protein
MLLMIAAYTSPHFRPVLNSTVWVAWL